MPGAPDTPATPKPPTWWHGFVMGWLTATAGAVFALYLVNLW